MKIAALVARVRNVLRPHAGIVQSWTDPQGNIWIALLCHKCGALHDAHIAEFSKVPTK